LADVAKEWDLPAMLADRPSARAATLVQTNPIAPTASSAVRRRNAIPFLRYWSKERIRDRLRGASYAINR
jgi:hypothetical protein